MNEYEEAWKAAPEGDQTPVEGELYGTQREKATNHEFVAANADKAKLTPDQQYSVAWGKDAVNTDWIKAKADALAKEIDQSQSTNILRNGYKRTNSSATNGDADKAAAPVSNGNSAGRVPVSNPNANSNGSDRGSRETSDWDRMSDTERAAWYSENPGFAKFTQFGQELFGATKLGALQQKAVPDFVERQNLIARGIDPDASFGIQSDDALRAINAADRGYDSDPVRSLDTESRAEAEQRQAEAESNTQDAISQMERESGGDTTSPSGGDDNYGNEGRNYTPAPSSDDNYSNEGRNHSSDNESSSGGSGGGGGSSRVICTHFYRKGEIDRDVWRADLIFTAAHLSAVTIRGYQFWAIPYVRLMRKSKLAEDIMRPIAVHRAQELAYRMGVVKKGSWRGKLVRLVMEPLCFTIGLFVAQQDWQSLWADVNSKGA